MLKVYDRSYPGEEKYHTVISSEITAYVLVSYSEINLDTVFNIICDSSMFNLFSSIKLVN